MVRFPGFCRGSPFVCFFGFLFPSFSIFIALGAGLLFFLSLSSFLVIFLKYMKNRRIVGGGESRETMRAALKLCGEIFLPLTPPAGHAADHFLPAGFFASVQLWDLSIILNEASRRAGAGGPFWIIG